MSSGVNLDKLIALLEQSRQHPVQLSLLVQRGEASEQSVLGRWEPPWDPRRVAEDACEIAQGDANAARARCSYALTVLSKPAVHRRLAFAPQPDAEPFAGPTEAPTPHGVNAMLMRHIEASARVQVGGRLELDQSWSKLFEFTVGNMERMEAQLRDADSRQRQFADLYFALQARNHEHELAMAQLAHEAQRTDQFLEKVIGPVLPHAAPQLSRAFGVWLSEKLNGRPAGPVPAGAAAQPPPPPPPPAEARQETPPASAETSSPPRPTSGLRDLVELLARHDIEPERVADLVADTLPEAERDAARAALHRAVREAFN